VKGWQESNSGKTIIWRLKGLQITKGAAIIFSGNPPHEKAQVPTNLP
jgi:hypothetical protein